MILDEPPSDFADAPLESAAPLSPSLANARRLAHFVPQLMVRFTYLNGATSPLWLYDSREEAWRAPIYLGATIELRLVWGLDGWIAPPIATSDRSWGSR